MSQLDTDLHEKNASYRTVYEQFERAVAIYQRISEESPSDDEVDKEEPKEEISQQLSFEGKDVVKVLEPVYVTQNRYEEEEEDRRHDDDRDRRPEEGEEYYHPYEKDYHYVKDYSNITHMVSAPTPVSAPVVFTPPAGPAAPAPPPADAADLPSKSALSPSTPSTPSQPLLSALDRARRNCASLRRTRDAIQRSLHRTETKLAFAREDYQRSLQAFDDLERELVSVSAHFEEGQRRALEKYFEGLEEGDGGDLYEEYRKVQGGVSEEAKRRKRAREEGEEREEVSVSQNGRSVEELEREIKKVKRGRNVAWGIAATCVAAVASAVGYVANEGGLASVLGSGGLGL